MGRERVGVDGTHITPLIQLVGHESGSLKFRHVVCV